MKPVQKAQLEKQEGINEDIYHHTLQPHIHTVDCGNKAQNDHQQILEVKRLNNIVPLPVSLPVPSVSLPMNLSRKVSCIIKEYLSERDVIEATLSVEELTLSSPVFAAVIAYTFNYSIESTRTRVPQREYQNAHGEEITRNALWTTSPRTEDCYVGLHPRVRISFDFI